MDSKFTPAEVEESIYRFLGEKQFTSRRRG